MKTCRGERIRAPLLNRPSCHNRACGATGQQDLTYAMSALHLLSCFPFMQVVILAFLNLLSYSPHCLEKNPQEQPFLPALSPSVPEFAPAALPSFRYLSGQKHQLVPEPSTCSRAILHTDIASYAQRGFLIILMMTASLRVTSMGCLSPL